MTHLTVSGSPFPVKSRKTVVDAASARMETQAALPSPTGQRGAGGGWPPLLQGPPAACALTSPSVSSQVSSEAEAWSSCCGAMGLVAPWERWDAGLIPGPAQQVKNLVLPQLQLTW